MNQTYSTNDIAKIIGIHVNTVRLYESCGLIQKPERKANGYRIFTDIHIEQFRMARAALQVEILQNGLRKRAIEMIKASANWDFDLAEALTKEYLHQIDVEIQNAEEAIEITSQILTSSNERNDSIALTRKETAEYLQITVDTLRNWELNGLIDITRKSNGYRIYTSDDIQRLKIIRSLRCANYSLSSILRMLNSLLKPTVSDIRKIIDTPNEDDDIITACDKLLSSLAAAKSNAYFVLEQIEKMKQINEY